MKTPISRFHEKLRNRKKHRLLTRFVSVTAAVIVFVTTYALILPAITMEEEALCGIPAHQHDDTCYERQLVCGLEESEDHVHTQDCYEDVLICGLEAHTHSAACYESMERFADLEEVEITEGLNSAAAVSSDLSSRENMFEGDSLSAEENAAVEDSLSVEAGEASEDSPTIEESLSAEESLSMEDNLSAGDGASDFNTMSVEGNISQEVPDTELTDAEQTESQDSASQETGQGDKGNADSHEGNADESLQIDAGEEIQDSEDVSVSGDELNAGAADSAESLDPAEADSDADGKAPADLDENVETDSEGDNAEGKGTDKAEPDAADTRSEHADAADAASTDTAVNPDTNSNTDKETETVSNEETNSEAAAGTGSSETAEVIPENSGVAQTGGINQAENTYTPVLDKLEFSRALNSNTGIYFHKVSDGETVADSLAVTDWKKMDDASEDSTDEKSGLLGPGDLIRIYLAYTIPAGSLNATNPVARYRLPSNLHLTDRQVEAINKTENGISKSYVNLNTLEITDPERHSAYMGLEAVEGSRKPSDDREKYLDKHPEQGGIECVSATVKIENVFEMDESGRESGEIIGQDLIITFSPYTIEKNRHDYDAGGKPIKAGEAVSGWLTLDFNMQQVDWITTDTDIDVLNADQTDAADTDVQDAEQADAADTEVLNADQADAADKAETAATENKEEDTGTDKTKEVSEKENTAGQQAENKTTTTVRKKAKIVFAENVKEDKKFGIRGADEISTTLQLEEVRVENTETSEKDESQKDKMQKAEEDDHQASVRMPAATFDQSILVYGGKLGSDTDTAETAAQTTTIKVHVEADEDTFPEGTTMVLANVTGDDLDNVAEAVEEAVTSNDSVSNKTRGFHAVDISFRDADGREIQPLKQIRVSMTSDTIKAAVEDKTTAPVVVHVEEKPTVMETTEESSADLGKDLDKDTETESDKETETESGKETEAESEEETETEAETGNGKEAETGDGEESEKETGNEVTDTLSFDADSFSVYAIVYTVDFHWEVNGKTYEFSLPGGGFVSFEKLIEVLGINNQDVTDESGSTALTLDGVEVSDVTREFVSDVESVAFSSPEFLDVSKVENENTVGGIKENRRLDGQYSADLTEEQIAEINETIVESGDWALISKQPFTSEETLTVTMKTGEVFEIRVTDYQISTNVLTADGKTYKITVTYREDARIPDTAELSVHEIIEEAEHQSYVTKTQGALGRKTNDSNARFFDISIVDKDGNEIQPAAEVFVEIRLFDTEIVENMQVVHFGEKVELMDLRRDSDSLNFSTDGFSIFAVVIIESEEGSYVFRGDGYTVSITYTAEAQIPLGTMLTVEELEPGSEQYDRRLGQAWCEINREYLEVAEQREHYEEWMGDLPDVGLVNLDHIRFFDIRLLYDGEIIEPVIPVQVEIAYDDGMTMAGDVVSGVVHYTEDAVELINEVDTITEGNSVLAFKYDQASFSDTGTYVGQKTFAEIAEPVVRPAPAPMQYPMLQQKTGANVLKAAGTDEPLEGEEEDEEGEVDDLTKPVATKTLTPNKVGDTNDGTYTLELAVDGRAKSSTTTEINKSNVLIIMDRSSSMVNNYPTGSINTNPVATRRNGVYYSENREFVPQPGTRYYGQVYSNGSNRYRELNYTTYTDNNGTHYRWTYVNTDDQTAAVTQYTGNNIYTGSYNTRLLEEQKALSSLLYDLLAKNGEGMTDDGISLEDIIEISVISFARQRGDKETHASTEVGWSTNYNELMSGVNSGFAPPGTNWEDALRYAMSVANEKMAEPGQSGEDMYIIFLTDGEPTAVTGESNGANHYGNTGGGFIVAYNAARDYIVNESDLTNKDYKFYGIFTWGENEEMTNYLKRLVNVAHGNTGTAETNFSNEAVDEDGEDDYFYNATSLNKLEEAFKKIFNLISDSVAYEQVSITDGLTTDAMTTTLVSGSTEGYKYTVYTGRVVDEDGNITSQGTPVYSVTVKDNDNEGSDPIVTFKVGNNTYPGVKQEYTYTPNGGETPVTKYYYVATVGEGEDAVEYKMALAELNSTGLLTWDLAGIGSLEDGYTYAVSFTVWPDQDAYDFVAALNNGLPGYQFNNPTYDSEKGYWEGEAVKVQLDEDGKVVINPETGKPVVLESYPSVIKYNNGTFAVRTNTDQNLTYSIVSTKTENDETVVNHYGPYEVDLKTPDPMPLAHTQSLLYKQWNIDRDPEILLRLLYKFEGEEPVYDDEGNLIPTEYSIGFDILQDTNTTAYDTVGLGWDGEKYVWDLSDSNSLKTFEYNGKEYTISTRWMQGFSIATGLMLSGGQMDAIGLDRSAYPSGEYTDREGHTTTYYLLEDGHDYTIREKNVSYEFDFEAPVYHPMLVDGVMKNVNFTKTDNGSTINFTEISALNINQETDTSSLEIVNTLRGYINLNKKVVGADGVTEIIDDTTKFEYIVELNNAATPFTIEGSHIPWYGISGLYYHDQDGNYYQAYGAGTIEVDGITMGKLTLKDEDGVVHEATCVGAFNENAVGPTAVTFTDSGKNIQLFGNQMDPSNETPDGSGKYKTATAIIKITRAQQLNIANVPVNTSYVIKENCANGYQLIKIERQTGNGNAVSVGNVSTATTTGMIVPNNETNITYTNRCDVITIQKLDGDGNGLEGAVFQIKAVNGSAESPVTGVEGIGEVTKVVDGKEKTFESSFETTGDAQRIEGLQDGTYRLREVYVPAGYISTVSHIDFEIENQVMSMITEDDTLEFVPASTSGGNAKLALLKITNSAGVALPSTGGPGSQIFMILGSILFAFAGGGLLMQRKKRMTT